jgi:uridylate kinase
LEKVLTEDKHKAGIHQILDPESVKLLKKSKTRVVVVNGSDSENVSLAVEGKSVGTIIE